MGAQQGGHCSGLERKNVEEQGGGHAHRAKRQILASDAPGGLAGHLRLAVSSLRPSTDPHMPSRVPIPGRLCKGRSLGPHSRPAGTHEDAPWMRLPEPTALSVGKGALLQEAQNWSQRQTILRHDPENWPLIQDLRAVN